MNRPFLLSTFLILSMLSICVAQDLVTDRPDFTESALVVPSKMIQLEGGVEFEDFNSVSTFSYPGILARIGIGYNLEIRLGFSGWLNEKIEGNSNTYLNDMILEAKYQITNDDAMLPIAVLLISTLPTGDDKVSVGSTVAGIKFASAYDLSEHLGLGVNLGAISVDVDSKQEILSLASVSLGIGINDKLDAFIETYAEIPQKEEWQPVLDGGFTFLLSPNAQLDFYMGYGLNDYTADLVAGAGLSFRFGY